VVRNAKCHSKDAAKPWKNGQKKIGKRNRFPFFFLMFSKSADVFPFAKNLAQNALENIFQKSVDPA
jgi:hypothetical protein